MHLPKPVCGISGCSRDVNIIVALVVVYSIRNTDMNKRMYPLISSTVAPCRSSRGLGVPSVVASVSRLSWPRCPVSRGLGVPSLVASVSRLSWPRCPVCRGLGVPSVVASVSRLSWPRCPFCRGLGVPSLVAPWPVSRGLGVPSLVTSAWTRFYRGGPSWHMWPT